MNSRTAILKEAEIFAARVVDSSTEGFALEVTGESEKLDEFIDLMRSYGEIEVTRSGTVAVSLETKKLRLSAPVLKNAPIAEPDFVGQDGILPPIENRLSQTSTFKESTK